MVGRGEQADPFYGWNLARHLDRLGDFRPIHIENLEDELPSEGVELKKPLPRLKCHAGPPAVAGLRAVWIGAYAAHRRV
jgi:hypothetical protein